MAKPYDVFLSLNSQATPPVEELVPVNVAIVAKPA